jgi:oxygen-independent coproporphyrinogen-3 oxidase
MSGLYIHIPFCEHKCIYCDFYSLAPAVPSDQDQSQTTMIARFLACLDHEIDLQGEKFKSDDAYQTVFFGGGTPSLLAPAAVGKILKKLSAKFSIHPDAEITLETNPGTVDVQKLKKFRDAGINRLSVGIQSFHDGDLRFLTRIHSSETARSCIRDAFEAGFEDVSIDLIFSLPRQTPERWRFNLEQAVALRPTHLSCYSLIVEPGTPLFSMVRNKLITPREPEADAGLYLSTIEFLSEHGYRQYEVSNFAKPGFESRHNKNYWNHTPYLGFGPSAHSYKDRKRWWNISDLGLYSEMLERGQLPLAGSEDLTGRQLQEETIFLGLRSGGIDLEKYREQFGYDLLETYKKPADSCIREGLAFLQGNCFSLTARGYALCDEICLLFR